MRTLQEVINARICCYEPLDIEGFDCHSCPYESENKGGLECSKHLQRDMFTYLKKYLNDIQKGDIRKTVENTWGQWEIGGRLGNYVPVCGSCGKVIARDHKFCPYCGAKIIWTKLK